eukprot:TRINITY_DN8969_c0_g1_i1.p1 TRINITY_DN8969_c0_g1~~TRINITY_DN8969_c0_g1_i1.p1  ORF type:complete len:279 (+),score=101.45 TRINITY_DN8969_c0_g1_i1:35-838(+)
MSDNYEENRERFVTLCDADAHSQAQLFLKSFIFELDEDWKDINVLCEKFTKYIVLAQKDEEGVRDLNAAQASDFLQQNGKTRTGTERKEELKDVDLNNDDRYSLIEYLLLHYKAMILRAYYKRHKQSPPMDLSGDAIGVTGVGPQLLDELFFMPAGLNAELEKAIEAFYAKQRARAERYSALSKVANGAGVKAFTAKNEMAQMDSEDKTATNREEITLNAARRKAQKTSSSDLLDQKVKAAEAEEKAKRDASRNALKARMAMFNSNE